MPWVEDAGRGLPRKDDERDGSAPLPSETIGVAVQVSLTHVVGFSMGGMLAMELGVTALERLETLTAISASLPR